MTSTNFNSIFGNVLYHHHIVSFLRNSLKHQMLSIRLLNWQQLIFNIIFLNITRVLFLTDLTVKFLEIILYSSSNYLLFDFGLIPFL